ncbi:MAG: hypothetical protein KAS92_09245, partial [Candidatus Omnitrophica bacterium]|nr:hypothetical protein [Candidatus Omnitrophota bacterium]
LRRVRRPPEEKGIGKDHRGIKPEMGPGASVTRPRKFHGSSGVLIALRELLDGQRFFKEGLWNLEFNSLHEHSREAWKVPGNVNERRGFVQ